MKDQTEMDTYLYQYQGRTGSQIRDNEHLAAIFFLSLIGAGIGLFIWGAVELIKSL